MIVLAGFNSVVRKDGIVTYISGNAEIGNGCKGRYVAGVVDFCEVKSDPPPLCFDAFIPLLRGSHDEWMAAFLVSGLPPDGSGYDRSGYLYFQV